VKVTSESHYEIYAQEKSLESQHPELHTEPLLISVTMVKMMKMITELTFVKIEYY
jgi:ssDNA-specific exonuclease RecJ